jgi:hypothetical protein
MKKIQYGGWSRSEFIEISAYVDITSLKYGTETQYKESK